MTASEDIDWNNERPEDITFTDEEVQNSLAILEELLHFDCTLPPHKLETLKRFVKHYHLLNEHKDATCGLWATDNEEIAKNSNCFKIEFGKKKN
jgi:hypothetical protein